MKNQSVIVKARNTRDGKWWAKLVDKGDGRCVARTAVYRRHRTFMLKTSDAFLELERCDFYASLPWKGSAQPVWLYRSHEGWRWRYPRRNTIVFSSRSYKDKEEACDAARWFRDVATIEYVKDTRFRNE
jgi:hypothetical protein